ncbi:MAG: carboxypeptidase regulatory-like domain-containing protein [Myxococcales bacterium]|nr:carboxypeptidase regulatory-like domain-containing protein [Myxococcales bacterium]
MSSRGALVTALLALAALLIWLAFRGDDAPTPPPETTSGAAPPTTPGPTGSSHAAPDRPTADEPALRLSGRVEAEGKPVAGAVVSLLAEQGDDPSAVRTDAQGRFELTGLAPGHYAASATAAGYLPAVQRGLDLHADATLTLTLDVGGHPLRGTVSDVTGGSIEGALVRTTPLSGVASLRRLDGFGTLADEDGGYLLQVAPGRYRVEVSHPDYAAERRTVEVGPGAQSQDFALVPMGVIEGTVREEEGGAPVPGAWVTWQRERQMTIAPGQRISLMADGGTVRADDEGRFRLRGLAPGAISLRARGPLRASDRPAVVPLSMAEHVTGVEVLVVAAHDLRGRVVAQDDPTQGIAGAEVQAVRDDPMGASVRTDAEGRFVLTGVLEGPLTLTADADGWLPSIPGVSAVAGPDAPELTIALARAPAIRGRVEPPVLAEVAIELRPETMRMGMAAPGAMIIGGGAAKTQTDGAGRFELGPAVPGPATVVARVADGRAGETTVEVGPDGADEVVIRLEERSTVRGVVRTASGQPVAQANVSLRPRRAPGAPDLRLTVNGRDMGVDSGTTTEDGRFEIGGVAAGGFELRVVDRYGEPLPVLGGLELGPDGAGVLTVSAGHDRDGVELRVDAPDGAIRGVVRTADGEPVPDAWVRATLLPEALGPRPEPEEDGPSERREMRMIVASGGDDGDGGNGRPPVLTDDHGRFELTGLRDAAYELVAESEGGRQRVTEVARPGDDVTLELAELGTIEGNVTLDGQPLPRFTVRVDGPTSRSLQVRDAGGRFELGRLDPGAYRLSVTAPDGTGHAEVEVEAGRSVTRNVVLEHLLTVRGRIVDEAGAPIEGAMILIGAGKDGEVSIEHQGEVEPNLTDTEGRFELTCASGPRALLAMSPTSPSPLVVHFFVAEPGQDVDLGDLEERKPEGRMVQQRDVEVGE